MSQQSFFNIQEISSRMYNPDSSILDTSLEHFGKEAQNTNNIMGKSAKKSVYPTYEEIIRIQQEEIERYKNALTVYINRIQDMEKGKTFDNSQEMQIKQLMVMINERQNEIADLKEKYTNAIMGLQQTVQKNSMLYREVQKYKKKHHDLELNYSRDQNVFNKSQNLISNLSITKSNYEIELVNMKDSLVILEKENKKIAQTNEEYEEKLALLSQEIERLRGVNESSRKELDKLRVETKQQQEFIRKIEYQNHELKQAIERMRNENQSFKNNNNNISIQLQEYHEKIMYNETLISDLQQREARMSQTLKIKDSQIVELESKVQWFTQQLERMEQEANRRNNQYLQELGKVRINLNQKSNSQKKIEIEKEQIIRQYNELIIRFESIKRQHQSILAQKDSAIKELQNLSHEKSELIREIEMRLNEREKMLKENESLKESLYKSETSFKLTKEEKAKQQQATIRAYEEKERNIIREYQLKLESLNEHKNNEINIRNNQINKLKNEIAAKNSQINQFKSEISNKSNEIAQLKQSTMSQSTLIDNTRRDLEEKIRERTQANNQLKIRLQNSEKLVEQSRRQRDLILQQNKTLLLQMQKNEQQFQLKNSDLKNCNQRIETLSIQIRQLQKQYEASIVDVENYKRILGDNQSALKQYHNKLKESQLRIVALTNQLQRITTILKEKEIVIFDLNAQNRQMAQYFEQKKGEVVSLREINQKLSTNLSRTEQSRGNFQLFMKEIERLNQVVSSKENEIKIQRLQIGKVIQKIDILYQQQLKIIQIIQNTYADESKRNVEMNNELVALKQIVEKLNQNTSFTLQDLWKQSGNILNILNTDSQTRNINFRMNQQLTKKDQEIALLKHQIQDLNIKLGQKQEQERKQQEIFQKLIELTQENAAIKEQLNYAGSEYEMEIEVKNKSIIELESKVNKYEKKQKQQIEEMKAYFSQKQQNYNDSIQRLNHQKQTLISRNNQIQTLLRAKEKQIQVIGIEKSNAQKKLDQMLTTINPRISQLEKTNELLALNGREIQKYKQKVRSLEAKIMSYEHKQIQSHQVSKLQRQVQKLQKILQIRNAQIASNQEGYFKLKAKLNEYEKQNLKSKNTIREQKNTIQTMNSQLRQLENNKNNNQHLQSVAELKNKNNQLQREVKSIQARLSDSQHRLAQANQQISTLQQQLQKILEMNSKSINKIQYFESKQAERQQLIERIHDLQEELEQTVGKLRQIQINYDFIRSNQEQNKIHLHAYEYKTNELQKEYQKLKEVLVNLNNENSKLLTKNHFFEVQLKKAQILQQKIQVLNGQINRLSSENINLSQQITSCKLALSGEYSLQKKSEEQLSLIVMLFAQVEALRNRLKQNELQLSYSHNQMLYKYRS